MTTRAYTRCNGGHYFSGARCPLDGWSSAVAVELDCAVHRLAQSGQSLSVASLLEAGVNASSLARIIVIEFGSEASCFDVIAPEGYVIDGQWCPLTELEDAFL
jgi:hypothetical protein